ncbi:MAG: proline--tRNA ligase [Dehalococcoidia bacterium]
MRLSHMFGKTLRQVPADAETESHKLLLRTGMVTPISAGVYAYLPLGLRVLKRIEAIIREEMDREGPGGRAGQELLMSSLVPIEFYEQSGRDKSMAEILFRLTDHHDRQFALGPTHEEVFVDVFKRNVQSYRDLPLMLYQIATKFRDEPRPRGGLIRLRQFVMKDLYSFDTDWEGLDVSYQMMFDAYLRVFSRCSVPVIPVLADSGAMGGRDTHEFLYLTDIGEDHCLLCPKCGYAANAEVATFVKEPAHAAEEPAAMEEIDTPGLTTIEQLANHLGVPKSKTCKAVFYEAVFAAEQASGQTGKQGGTTTIPVFVAIRGDMDVNEAKLRNALGAIEVRYMDEDAVKKAGFVAGSASAVGLKGIKVVADDLVTLERNLVAGANKPDKHFLNTNHGRDWQADIVDDIALAAGDMLCANCRTPMDERRGIEMGQVFKLGLKYSEAFGAYFLDAEGKQQPAVMGSYGIGIERLVAAIIEENHDESGIIWPPELAPYDVHVVALKTDEAAVREAAETLVRDLEAAGLQVLYDDRDESPGVKFNDADLLGMPVRATVSPRNLEKGSVELRRRAGGENELVALDTAVDEIRARLSR